MKPTKRNPLLAGVIPLAKSCPVDRVPPEDCPLHALRPLKRTQQRQWFAALKEDEIAYLTAYCHVCAEGKLAGKSSPSSR